MHIPQHAGSFYPSSKEEIENQIKSFKSGSKKEKVKGIILPHAGWVYSGECANLAISSVKQDFDSVIILGTDHAGTGVSLSLEDFQTPLGIIKNDKELSKELSRNIRVNESAFSQEHSIEVQLPFLQTYFSNFEIVPIIVGTEDINQIKKLAEIIFNVLKKLKRKTLIIASSDFIHYGENYNFLLSSYKEAEKLDKQAIKNIENLNTEKFLSDAEKTTICGKGAISLCIEICKFLGAEKGKLIDFRNSGRFSGENLVDYASLIFS